MQRDESVGLKAGMRGMAEGYDPHMLDISPLVLKSWAGVNEMAVGRCWVKSQVLPVSHAAEVSSTFGKMKNTTKDAKVQEIVSILSKLYVSLDRRDPIDGQMDVLPTAADIKRWLYIEADGVMRSVIVKKCNC